MRTVGIVVVIVLTLAILAALGYAVVLGFGELALRWNVLDEGSQAFLVVICTVLVACTLLVVVSMNSSARMGSPGRTLAYDEFVHWYSNFKAGTLEDPLSSFIPVKNLIALWAGNQVAKQAQRLYEELSKETPAAEELTRKGDNVYLEIRRDLGRRSAVNRELV